MKYVILAMLAILLFGIKIRMDTRKKRQRMISDLLAAWGEVPNFDRLEKRMTDIRGFFDSCREDGDIDDITWNDLDMDDLFTVLNTTCSSIGEEYLYSYLRKPYQNHEEQNRRNTLMHFFEKNEKERLNIQLELSSIGKLMGLSVYRYITLLNEVEEKPVWPHYIIAALMLLSPFLLFYSIGTGVLAILICYMTSTFTYYQTQKEVGNYFKVTGYITRMVHCAENLEKLHIKELNFQKEELKQIKEELKPFLHGAWLLDSTIRTKYPEPVTEMIMEWARTLLHVDLIKFYSMVGFLKQHQDTLRKLFSHLGYLDAVLASASYRALFPVHCEPILHQDKTGSYKMEGGYHPLVEHPVSNSIQMSGSILVTGSNASGKSTFLKTVALNALLAQTVGTCHCTHYEASFFRIYSSMSLRDDITGKDSYYIVEIKSLKRIMDHAAGEIPILCFVDEVLRGTNTLERIAASSRILKYMEEQGMLCCAATHDIELTHILERYYTNYHFHERVEENQILFDYKLHEGRAVTKNAIQLLRILGYSEELTALADADANTFLEHGIWQEFK